MSNPRRDHIRAIIVAVFVTALWSSSWVLIRFGLDDEGLTPLTFAGIRYVVAAVILVGVVVAVPRHRGEIRTVAGAAWRRLAFLGVVIIAVTQGAQFLAIATQPAATTSLVLSLTPLLVAAGSTAALGERPDQRQLLGTGLIVAGAAAYFMGDLGFTAPGMAAAAVCLVFNSIGALLGRSANRGLGVSPLLVTTVSICVGSVILLGVGIAAEGMPVVTGRAWAIIVWLAAVNTAWAITLWNWSLRRLTATESAAVNNTMLIQIGILAWLFLGEAPGPLDLAGMAAVSVGVYLAQRPPAKEPVAT